ncbi:MAG: chromosome segregation protein SMC [Candidatus Kapaibacterium sp.]
MYLSKLDIVGFKSFAQKTNLKFSDGISAVVGPNGCGKSNIVDAIRWVLGEQKTSVLRSEHMENVIFNGTKTRKPLGMAEVSITIQNNRQALPIEYSEVTVARRLFRDGQSHYLLNNTQCRLKDILDLFMDTGLGPDSYSVIELKMVEAILSGRVDDRRHMLEEAAGIKKYKLRRKETSRKLLNVQADLDRVLDIVQEVKTNVNSLSRQAAKTKRYHNFQNELREKDIKAAKFDYDLKKLRHDELKSEILEIDKQKNRLEIEIGQSEKEIARLKEILSELDTEYHDARANEAKFENNLSMAVKDLAVTNEKLSGLHDNKGRLEKELKQTAEREAEINENLEKLKINADENKSKLESLTKALEVKKEELRAREFDAGTFREESSRLNEEIITLNNRINSLNDIKSRNQRRIESLISKKNEAAGQKSEFERQMQQLEEDIIHLKNHAELSSAERDEAESELNMAGEKKQSLQNELNDLTNSLNDKKSLLGSRNASLQYLERLSDTTGANAYLSKNTEWKKPKNNELAKDSGELQLGELTGTDEKYRVAVEAALGEAVHYLVVNSKDEAFRAFDLLKKNSKGKAAFLCRDMIKPLQITNDDTPEGTEGRIINLVRVDDDIRSFLDSLWGDMVVAGDIESAREAIASGKASSAVTLEGELFGREGVIKGGSKSGTEGAIIGKKERIDNLKKEIAEIETDINALNEQSGSLKEDIALIDLNALKNALRRAEEKMNDASRKLDRLELNKQSIDNNIELADRNIANYDREITEAEEEAGSNDEDIAELEKQLLLKKEEYNSRLSELNSAEESLNEVREEFRELEINTVDLRSALQNNQNQVSGLENQLSRLESDRESKKNMLISGDSTEHELKLKIKEIEQQINELEANLDKAKSAAAVLREKRSALRTDIDGIQSQLNEKHKQYDGVKESIHKIELKDADINASLNNITSRIIDSYETDIANLLMDFEEDFNIELIKAEIIELKTKLSALGPVNFTALDEYESQSERLTFYESQVNDLQESEKTLLQTIEEINETAERKFMDTFELIRKNFRDLFQKLFSADGEADLKMEEGNPLEADIEITAKPPNKKPSNIEQLSGGEKTLTAIALLFAIYLVKPSPFCILDEVDAPLDDANVGKFVTLIKEFSEKTQFLIVTHNKKTMEAADNLYGVTMQEDGVSKTVSVRIDPALQEG